MYDCNILHLRFYLPSCLPPSYFPYWNNVCIFIIMLTTCLTHLTSRLTIIIMSVAVFCDMTPCRWYFPLDLFSTSKIERTLFSETSVYVYQTVLGYILEVSDFVVTADIPKCRCWEFGGNRMQSATDAETECSALPMQTQFNSTAPRCVHCVQCAWSWLVFVFVSTWAPAHLQPRTCRVGHSTR
jgi:hypothetical protein